MQKCIDILYYLFKTKQWITEYKQLKNDFKKVRTQKEELIVCGTKIVRCNNLIGTPLHNYLLNQIIMFEKEELNKRLE